ncbi:MAG: histidinol-phosphatase [Candidatus Izimaplasma sp.]|nr:histidinol-phosphatase [Candidatus Izimaplasma bacterium]
MNKPFNRNYHTHCYLCKHAKGTIEDYIVEAINKEFKAIGISDHAPLDFLEDRSLRMASEDYPLYLKQMKQALVKYYEYILIYKSLEIEYFDFLHKHYENLLNELDYLILGQHYIKDNNQLKSVFKIKTYAELKIYKETIINAMRTNYFKIIAHPDIFLINQPEISEEVLSLCKEIILVAKEENVLLEINANGFRKKKHDRNGKTLYQYPRKEFWKLVKDMNAPAIISADAHHPKHLSDYAISEAQKMIRDLSLEVEEELVLD